MPSDSCVEVEHVYKGFGNQVVLQDISLKVPKSQIFGLLGPSGSGKTTLVKLISGIDEATSGKIRLLNITMPKLEMMKQIGYMSQSDALYMELSAQENLEFFSGLFGITSAARKIRIQEVMEL